MLQMLDFWRNVLYNVCWEKMKNTLEYRKISWIFELVNLFLKEIKRRVAILNYTSKEEKLKLAVI